MKKLDKFLMTQKRTKCCRDLWCFKILLQVKEPDKPRPLQAFVKHTFYLQIFKYKKYLKF